MQLRMRYQMPYTIPAQPNFRPIPAAFRMNPLNDSNQRKFSMLFFVLFVCQMSAQMCSCDSALFAFIFGY